MQAIKGTMCTKELLQLLQDEDRPVEVDYRINWKDVFRTEAFNVRLLAVKFILTFCRTRSHMPENTLLMIARANHLENMM